MTTRASTWMLLTAIALCAGCVSRGNTHLLESRLRRQEDQLNELETELASARSDLVSANRKSRSLREQLAARGKITLLPEQADAIFRAEGVQFSKMRTGGLDRDGKPGDDVLTAVLVPHDSQGEPVKVPGKVELELFDMSMSGSEQKIGTWNFDVDESHKHWHRGFLGSGYFFRVPWQQTPENSELVLHGRLTTSDGRQFDTSQTIKIKPTEVPFDSEETSQPIARQTDDEETSGPGLLRR